MDDGAIFQFDRDCFVGAFHKESNKLHFGAG